METGKRKRPADGVRETKNPRAQSEDGDRTTVTEAEVEEFFAILRRMRESARCLAVRNGKVTEVAEKGVLRWRPAFSWSDFEEEADAVKDDGRKANPTVVVEEKVEENAIRACLDLNAEPEPDLAGHRGGDVTARCAS